MLDKVEGELQAFTNTMKNSPNFAAFLMNPTIPRAEKTTKVNINIYIYIYIYIYID